MAHDVEIQTNKGFNEVACENALERINSDYAKLMVQVPEIQSVAIESLCENWISKKGKENIEKIVRNFNKLLDGITIELGKIFVYTNQQANVVAQDSDGIAYNPVKFEAKPDRFSDKNAKDDVENGKVAQWDEEATGIALKQAGNFIDAVSKTMKNVEGDVDTIEKAFGSYSEAGYNIAIKFKQLGANVTSLVMDINRFLEPLEDSYGAEAAAHRSNVQEMSTKAFQEADSADFTFE